jgi:hypothetical protein
VVDVAEFFITPMVFADPPTLAAAFGADPVFDLIYGRVWVRLPVGIGGYIFVDTAGDPSHVAGFFVFAVVILHLMPTAGYGFAGASANKAQGWRRV